MTVDVDFIVEHIPHYRTELVRKLDTSSSISVTWVADNSPGRSKGIPPTDYCPLRKVRVSNVPGPCGFLWQRGVLSHSLRTSASAVVMTGDPRVISTWLSTLVLRARGKMVIFWTHGWRRRDAGVKRVTRLSFYNLASALFVYSQRGAQLALIHGYKKPVCAVGNSNGAPIVGPSIEDAVRPRGVQKWVVVTRLIRDRRIDLAIEAVAYLAQSNRRVDLTVVGEGESRDSLIALAAARGVKVNFLGALFGKSETGALFSSSDIAVFPGHVGLGAVHSLSSGCPVATHDDMDSQMPEAEAIVDGVTGVLFRKGDVADLANRVWNFVEENDRGVVVNNCHEEVASGWSADSQARKMEGFLTDSKFVR